MEKATTDLYNHILRLQNMGTRLIYEGLHYMALTDVDGIPKVEVTKWLADTDTPQEVHLLPGTTGIAPGTFANSDLCKIYMPDTMETIWDGAFSKCYNLHEVHISPNVEFILDNAFEFCVRLETLDLRCKADRLSMGCCFSCSSLKEVWLPESLELIEQDAFWECGKLTTVHIPKTGVSLSPGAFYTSSKNLIRWEYYGEGEGYAIGTEENYSGDS